MGLCNNNSLLYSEAKTTSANSRKSVIDISSFTTNRFVKLPAKLDNEPNLIVESFTSENITFSSLLSVIDADNPDSLPLKK